MPTLSRKRLRLRKALPLGRDQQTQLDGVLWERSVGPSIPIPRYIHRSQPAERIAVKIWYEHPDIDQVLKRASDSQFFTTLSYEACAVEDLDPIKDGSDTGRHHAPCVTMDSAGRAQAPRIAAFHLA
jgi:hypothetical protein